MKAEAVRSRFTRTVRRGHRCAHRPPQSRTSAWQALRSGVCLLVSATVLLIAGMPAAHASLVGDQVTVGIFVQSGVGTIVVGPTVTVGVGDDFVVTQTLGTTLLVTHTIDVTDRGLTIRTTSTGSGGGGTSIRFTFSSLDSAGGTVAGFQKTSDAQTQVNNPSFTDHSITFDLGFFTSPSSPRTTTIAINFVGENTAPVADAGADLAAAVGQRVQLSGLQSFDGESPTLALQYQWTIESAPSGSTAVLENAAIAVTGFTPDIPGDYILALVVRDEGGLASEAAYASVTAEIEPAFVYERRASGTWNARYGPYRYEFTSNYFYPYGLANGRPYGVGQQYSYSYDWSAGSYTYQYSPRLSWLDASGEDRLVESGDPIPGSNGATFEYVWPSGRSGSTLGFYGQGRNAEGQWSWGDFRVQPDGSVSAAPSGPIPIQGDDEQLRGFWRNWNSFDLSLVYGYTGRYNTRERTASYSCGADNLETCTYTYTEYLWQYGLYVLDGATAIKVVDTFTAVPGEQANFSGFGAAARDAASGTFAFVGYWTDGEGKWHQGLYRKDAAGAIAKAIDDRDPQMKGGWFGRIAIDGDKVYFGGVSYWGYEYGEGAGGSRWWSAYRTGIYSVTEGAFKAEVEGGYAWFQRWSPDFYQYSYAYSSPDYWNFAVGHGVLGFSAWSYFYTYDSSTQNWGYSQDQGAYWKENGQVRGIARSGDTLAGTQYQSVWGACCYGDWLEKKTAVLTAQNNTWTYDSSSNESVVTGSIDTILARFDSDRDGRGDDVDNCPLRPNPDQLDSDGNGTGDVCEDTDLDGWQDIADNCPVKPNNQNDVDGDARGDACDVCPFVADDQADQDGDGIGDSCDNDNDNDTVADDVDNCPNAPNSGQANMDGDSLGDACDPDIDGDGISNAVDGRWDGQHYNDQSLTSSDDFSDHQLGGRSYGRISGRGQLIILVEDAPGGDQGLLISAVNGSGNGMVKQCDFKGKDASVRLEQGSVVTVTCGSLSVRALARGAQIVLDDDVLIDVQQQSEARVVGLGNGEFRVENAGDTPLPLVVNLGGDVQVAVPTSSTTTISEPEPGNYQVQNTAESAQPVTVTVEGRTTEIEPGETSDVEQLRDATAPVITPTVVGRLGSGGWYTSDVQVTWNVADSESSVSSSNGCGSSLVVTDTTSTVFTCSATSVGGTASQSVTVKRDATPPQVSVSTPVEGAMYTLNQSVAAAFSCGDPMSGVVSCTGAVPSGSFVDTASPGSKTFSVTASDVAGNTASTAHSYAVRYRLVGFQQPIDNLPVVNSASAGKTIPVKWQLQDANGAFVTGLGAFRSLSAGAAACASGALLDEIEEVVAAGGTVLRYDATANQFVYNWAAPSTWKGTCRKLVLELADGQKREAMFKFK